MDLWLPAEGWAIAVAFVDGHSVRATRCGTSMRVEVETGRKLRDAMAKPTTIEVDGLLWLVGSVEHIVGERDAVCEVQLVWRSPVETMRASHRAMVEGIAAGVAHVGQVK